MSALISFAQAVSTVHGLLVSIGSLMTVNATRSLSQTQEKEWEIYIRAKESGVPIIEPKVGTLQRAKNLLKQLWGINVILGTAGILLDLGFIVIAPESIVGNWYLLVVLIWILLISQLLFFALLSLRALWALGIWLQKP